MAMSDDVFKRLVLADFGKPPAWCSNAVATEKGWVNPKTGEIYSCIPKLKSRIEEFEAEKARRAAEAAVGATVVETVIEESDAAKFVAPVKETKAPAKKKPAAKKTTTKKTK